MTLTISKKTFLVFALMTMFTLLLGITVYMGLAEIERAKNKLLTVKEFQLEINRLETIRHRALDHMDFLTRSDIKMELAKILSIAADLKAAYLQKLRNELLNLPQDVDNYQKAFEELVVRYENSDRYNSEIESIMSDLQIKAARLPDKIKMPFFSDLLLIRGLNEQIYHGRDMGRVSSLKNTIMIMMARTTDKEIHDVAQALLLKVDGSYFNYLAIVDKEDYLEGASAHFIDLTGNISSVAIDEIHHRQRFLKIIIVIIISVALLSNISLWLLTTRYIMRFQRSLTYGIKSVKSGNYSYEVCNVSKDELGELITFMKEMAIELERNINQVTEGKAFLQKIIDGIAEPIMFIDKDLNVLLLNSEARKSTGKEVHGERHHKCYELSHDRTQPCSGSEHPCPFEIVKVSREKVTLEHIHIDVHGQRRNIEIMASPFLGEDGSFEGIIEATRDITDRKKLEEQLTHSQKMEAIGLLTGGIAHDFNNLLTTIIGFGELLAADLSDKKEQQYMEAILSASERAATLTRSLLAFSRKQAMNPVAVDINDVIRNFEKLLSRLIGEDIAIVLKLNEAPIVINADAGQLEQIFLNLGTNARDAMLDGGSLHIDTEVIVLDDSFVSAHNIRSPGEYALVTVTDTGKGMDAEVRDQIFEPYFTTKELGRGTGLGLSVVYGIVKQHKGEIFVYSELGEGTTFKIYFPLLDKAPEEKTVGAHESLKYGSETILVSEDDSSVMDLLKQVLRRYGYTVIASTNGKEAVKQYKEHMEDIDLLLFDVLMPEMNGVEALDEIRKITEDVKVLFISGYPSDVLDAKGIISTEPNYVSKPISPVDLIKKIQGILGS